jgi:2-succinyl-5-enolpyruvyl-6-hydroxy-3-cyclohexene-1-carboxylate synthase
LRLCGLLWAGLATEMSPENLQTQWARLLVTTVVQAGVSDVVISPGSRSTPFVHACLETADLRCHQVIDERSAAFFALGQARISGRPTMLLCTSGTAGAHYFPAVIEAAYAGLPLLVVTADRPPELQDCGAPQTIDQKGLFGRHVRAFHELGMAEPDSSALLGLRNRVSQAVSQTIGPEPGPVHINAAARKPLEPVGASTAEQLQLCELVDQLCAQPLAKGSASRKSADQDAVAALARRCRELPCGIIVAGPARIGQSRLRKDVQALSEATGYPVLCDLASQLAGGQPGHALLDGFFGSEVAVERIRPDLILQLGSAPVSSQFARLLSGSQDIERYVLTESGLHDPWRMARAHIRGSLFETVPSLVAELAVLGPLPTKEPRFDEVVAAARSCLFEVQQELLAESPGTRSEAFAVRELLRSLPDDGLLVLGNSLAIRIADLWGGKLPSGVAVLSQRGVSGIDGLLSGAIGAAMASGRPTALLLGDVSLLHDLTALGLAAIEQLRSPLVVAVLNNDGGRIFEHLPVRDSEGVSSDRMAFWTTPHGHHFEHAARMFARSYQQLQQGESCHEAFVAAWQSSGLSLVEVMVPSDASVLLNQQLRVGFASALQASDALAMTEVTGGDNKSLTTSFGVPGDVQQP